MPAGFAQDFFAEGRYLGSVERRFDLTKGVAPLSYAFFCHACGDVFAKAPIPNRPWQYWSRTCRKCPGSETLGIPGSLWLSWDTEYTDALPAPVLQWELERELEFFDKRAKL